MEHLLRKVSVIKHIFSKDTIQNVSYYFQHYLGDLICLVNLLYN